MERLLIVSLLNRIGEAWALKNEHDIAIRYFSRSIDILQKIYPENLSKLKSPASNIANSASKRCLEILDEG